MIVHFSAIVIFLLGFSIGYLVSFLISIFSRDRDNWVKDESTVGLIVPEFGAVTFWNTPTWPFITMCCLVSFGSSGFNNFSLTKFIPSMRILAFNVSFLGYLSGSPVMTLKLGFSRMNFLVANSLIVSLINFLFLSLNFSKMSWNSPSSLNWKR